MSNTDIFFSKSFNIEGYSIYVFEDEFMYTIFFKSKDNLFSTSIKIRYGVYQRKFSNDDEELIKNLISKKTEFSPNQIFSNLSEVIIYLNKIK